MSTINLNKRHEISCLNDATYLTSFLINHHAMKTHWERWGAAPRILKLGIRLRWVVTYTPRPL